MAPIITGSPAQAFGEALFTKLSADVTLLALATGGVFAALPRAARAGFPYVVIGRRETSDDGAAMQIEAGIATVFIDVWSDYNGPTQVQTIQARLRTLLQRQPVAIAGSSLHVNDGSVHCLNEFVMMDYDPDMPERTLFHGVQEWSAWIEEAA